MIKPYEMLDGNEKNIRLKDFKQAFCKAFCDLPYRNKCEAHCLINYLTVENANKIRINDIIEVRRH